MKSNPPAATDVGSLVDHLFRQHAGRMLATLTRLVGARHLALAEEVVQDALITALQQWPFQGVPANPSAWLVQVAKHRALDRLRRDRSFAEKEHDVTAAFESRASAWLSPGAAGEKLHRPFDDDELCMMFMACHPDIPRESRVALTLKTVGGFSVPEIAQAFLAREAAVAQRLVRVKRFIRERDIPLDLPVASEMSARLDSVLEVLYLMFNEGYAAHSGESLVRHDLVHEAIRLARMLMQQPATALPRTHALVALMLLQAARIPARADADGDLFVLEDQDRAAWDRAMIADGMRHLDASAQGDEVSAYHLQAGIAAAHAAAPSYAATDWREIVSLYDALLELEPSPVVALNRAIALSRVDGPDAGLRALDPLRDDPTLAQYVLFHATLGELSREAGDAAAAARHYDTALALPSSAPARRCLERRRGTIRAARP
ncbi:MAG: RNA polymerase sigma factor [Vicinamibacterales bacterium]